MPLFPLLHSYDQAPSGVRPGLFPILDGKTIPAAWQPTPAEYDPVAFPTPFARAEATRLVLTQVEDAGPHPLWQQFRVMLLGVASGALELALSDLATPAYDNFGSALLRVDAEARYFCRVLSSDGSTTFGATYRTCLFWGHARRQSQEWDQIHHAILPREKEALQVLADWRQALRDVGRWDGRVCGWQRGVDAVVGETPASEGLRTLHEDTRFVGPVLLELPSGDPTEPTSLELVHLPRHAPGFARAFQALCRLEPKLGAEGIELRAPSGAVVGAIALPPVGADTDALAVGLGGLKLPSVPAALAAAPEGGRRWVDGPGGLLELLEPVRVALSKRGHMSSPDAHVVKHLPFYPDAIRLLAKTRARVAGGETYSARADSLLLARGVGLPDAAAAEAAGGVTALVEAGGRTARIVLLDSLDGVEILDLRALGAVLWAVYDGDARASDNGANVLTVESGRPMMTQGPGPTLDPQPWVYDAVSQAPGGSSRRLATLQRFVASYSIEAGRAGPLDGILDRAARSFARWAAGVAEVTPMGRQGVAAGKYSLPIGVEARLVRDALTSV